ncbi:MAG: YchE family NAAT transporter [Methyloprofundus sp.]|nr:YchE family NAAT transporter [Methyloprofundus sp.]
MLEYTDYIKIFIALLAVLDPLAAVPVVVTLTSGSKDEDLKKIVSTVIVTVLTILIVTLFIGEHLLDFFGITINSFRIAGGILLMMMAISMLHGKMSETSQTEQEMQEGNSKESIAVVPLSIPLLAGPGAISTVILYAHRGTDINHYLMMMLIIVFVVLILWVVLASVPWISKHISHTGINVFARLMGLIVAAFAVEFIANGLKGLFPVLAMS